MREMYADSKKCAYIFIEREIDFRVRFTSLVKVKERAKSKGEGLYTFQTLQNRGHDCCHAVKQIGAQTGPLAVTLEKFFPAVPFATFEPISKSFCLVSFYFMFSLLFSIIPYFLNRDLNVCFYFSCRYITVLYTYYRFSLVSLLSLNHIRVS
jgi:hypothetical protein